MDFWVPNSIEEVVERAQSQDWTELAATPTESIALKLIRLGWRADRVVVLPHPFEDAQSRLTDLCTSQLGHTDISDARVAPLSNLTSLHTLSLRGVGISDHGVAHLSKLTNLRKLDLSENWIGADGLVHLLGLSNLHTLGLSGNGITAKGARHVSELTGLHTLDLAGNWIGSSGVAQLSKLSSLRTLDLTGNWIGASGVAQLCRLNSLRTLHLGINKIGDNGASHLTGLTGLRILDLGENEISDDGLVHLSGLTHLRTLNLEYNRIRTVPDLIFCLPDLYDLRLRGNLLDVPREQISSTTNPQELRELLRQAHAGMPLLRAKVVILGEPQAGKTYLRCRLAGQPPKGDGQHVETHSYDFVDTVLEVLPPKGYLSAGHADGPIEFSLRCYDFAGQEVLHGTHRFFMASLRNAYIVCVDATLDRPQTRVDYWLRLVAHEHRRQRRARERYNERHDEPSPFTRGTDDDASTGRPPSPVVVVLTRCAEKDRAGWLRGGDDELRGRLMGEFAEIVGGPVDVVVGYDGGTRPASRVYGLQLVKDALGGAVRQLDEVWRTGLPRTFNDVLGGVERDWQAQTPWLRFGDAYKQFFDEVWFQEREGGPPALLERSRTDFLYTLRDIGVVHWLGDWPEIERMPGHILRDTILNPAWVHTPIYEVLRDPQINAARGRATEAKVRAVLANGVREVEGGGPVAPDDERVELVFSLMQASGLLVPNPNHRHEFQDQADWHWLAPDLLPLAKVELPGVLADPATGLRGPMGTIPDEHHRAMFGFLPDYALLPMIAANLDNCQFGDEQYREALRLRVDGVEALVVLRSNNGEVDVHLWGGDEPKRAAVLAEIGYDLMKHVDSRRRRVEWERLGATPSPGRTGMNDNVWLARARYDELRDQYERKGQLEEFKRKTWRELHNALLAYIEDGHIEKVPKALENAGNWERYCRNAGVDRRKEKHKDWHGSRQGDL